MPSGMPLIQSLPSPEGAASPSGGSAACAVSPRTTGAWMLTVAGAGGGTGKSSVAALCACYAKRCGKRPDGGYQPGSCPEARPSRCGGARRRLRSGRVPGKQGFCSRFGRRDGPRCLRGQVQDREEQVLPVRRGASFGIRTVGCRRGTGRSRTCPVWGRLRASGSVGCSFPPCGAGCAVFGSHSRRRPGTGSLRSRGFGA